MCNRGGSVVQEDIAAYDAPFFSISPAEVRSIDPQLSTATSMSEAVQFILDGLLTKLSRSLMMPREKIDQNKPLSRYGINSSIGVELRNWIIQEAKVQLPLFEIVQATSLTALAREVAQRSEFVVSAREGGSVNLL